VLTSLYINTLWNASPITSMLHAAVVSELIATMWIITVRINYNKYVQREQSQLNWRHQVTRGQDNNKHARNTDVTSNHCKRCNATSSKSLVVGCLARSTVN